MNEMLCVFQIRYKCLSTEELLAVSMCEEIEMISAYDAQEFVPNGRHYCSLHPGKTKVHMKGADVTDHGLPIVKALRDFSISTERKVIVYLCRLQLTFCNVKAT